MSSAKLLKITTKRMGAFFTVAFAKGKVKPCMSSLECVLKQRLNIGVVDQSEPTPG